MKHSSEKKELAQALRGMSFFGWDECTFGHGSLRIQSEKRYLINPEGVAFSMIQASDVVLISADGRALEGGRPASFKLHKHLHEISPDHQVVLHSHYTPCITLANHGVLPFASQFEAMAGPVSFLQTPFSGLFEEKFAEMGKKISVDSKVLFCEQHGVFVFGKTVPEAFLRLYLICRGSEVFAQTHLPMKNRSSFEMPFPDGEKVLAFWNEIGRRVQICNEFQKKTA